jgi:MFS transporter, ACS family, solute carrier family 17 (sodium-dependent inorganic phosphate cotransporter), other
MQAGTIISLLVAPLIIKSFSWEYVFLIFGAVGFVWLAGWAPQRLQAQQAANARFAANRALELPPITEESLLGTAQNGSGQNNTGTAEKPVVAGTSGALEEAKARREEMLATVRSTPCAVAS